MLRRDFLTAMSGLAAFAATPRSLWAQSRRPRIAFIGTEVRQYSHAQHFLDRLTLGYSWQGGWHEPRVDVAGVYIDQFPKGDLGRGRIQRHKLKQFPSIAEALTLGGSDLAVDGVVIIAEHGDYPKTEQGQPRYPRYQWFKEVVQVFEQSGRAVPVFNDKHLSTDWDECVEMVADSRRLGFPFLAGSSLPVTRRLPAIDMPYGADLRESVCVAYSGVDDGGFHAHETAQCMSERRRGGEVGLKSLHALRGKNLWQALDADGRGPTRDLIAAALHRSHNLPVEGGFPTDKVTYDWARRVLSDSIGYLMEHRDGFRTSILLTSIRDFNYAGQLGDGNIVSCQMYLPMPGHGSTTADFFNPLTHYIEELIVEGRAAYPVERTLLTSGMVIGVVDSLHQGGQLIETPHLDVKYEVPDKSWFWRD